MKTNLKSIAAVTAVLLSAAAAPAFANAQLIANAGLTPAEAQGLSLSEIAAAKFSRNADHDDRQIVVVPGTGGDYAPLAAAAGLSPAEASGLTLTELAVAKFNVNADHENRQGVVRDGGVTAMSRSVATAAWAQLAANAGLSVDEAAGMTLSEIAAAKFSRNADHDDRIVGY